MTFLCKAFRQKTIIISDSKNFQASNEMHDSKTGNSQTTDVAILTFLKIKLYVSKRTKLLMIDTDFKNKCIEKRHMKQNICTRIDNN